MLLSFESTYLAAQLERRNHSQYLVSGASRLIERRDAINTGSGKQAFFWSLARLI